MRDRGGRKGGGRGGREEGEGEEVESERRSFCLFFSLCSLFLSLPPIVIYKKGIRCFFQRQRVTERKSARNADVSVGSKRFFSRLKTCDSFFSPLPLVSHFFDKTPCLLNGLKGASLSLPTSFAAFLFLLRSFSPLKRKLPDSLKAIALERGSLQHRNAVSEAFERTSAFRRRKSPLDRRTPHRFPFPSSSIDRQEKEEKTCHRTTSPLPSRPYPWQRPGPL